MNTERLHYLLEKNATGGCTQAEQQELQDWYDNLAAANEHYSKDIADGRSAKLAEELLAQFRRQLNERRTPVRRIRWKRIAIAASVILFLSMAGLYWLINYPGQQVTIAEEKLQKDTDIGPGGNHATLTLDNGTTIWLDTVTNGNLAMQPGSIISKPTEGLLVYKQTASLPPQPSFNKVTTPRGGQYHINLPDGTDVWLNAASSISYPVAFTGNMRNVDISGEAYFEVASEKNKPFVVSVNGMEVEVLGTHFNIMAYTDEESTMTSLLEGRVKVRKITAGHSKAEGEILLSPGQQASYNRKGIFSIIKKADMEEAVAWKNGFFQFNDADIRMVLRQAARWYDIEVIENGNIPNERYRGKIARDVKLSGFLKILELNNIRFVMDGRKLIINP